MVYSELNGCHASPSVEVDLLYRIQGIFTYKYTYLRDCYYAMSVCVCVCVFMEVVGEGHRRLAQGL